MESQSKPNFRLYPTLLDAWQDYIDTPVIYDRYWGFSAEPENTLEEFWLLQHKALIDRINRVPFESEAASRGTAFNAVVDLFITGEPVKNVAFEKVYTDDGKPLAVRATHRGYTFDFPFELCKEFAQYYKGAIPQQFVSAIIHTGFGDVELYGFLDELMPFSVHDIKTTSSYYAGKFKHHNQHLVYPYCLIQNGTDVRTFEYNIAEIGKSKWQTYTETYVFEPERDIPILRQRCEGLIEFMIQNIAHIKDRKVFGGENPEGYVGQPIDINELTPKF